MPNDNASIADVLIPLALDTAYSYAVPDGLVAQGGRCGAGAARHPRDRSASSGACATGAGGNFKPVTGVIEAPASPPTMRKFLDWVAWYTLAPKGSALAMGLKLAGRGPGRGRRASASGSPGRRRSA